MFKQKLKELVNLDKPLVEATFILIEGVNLNKIIKELNGLDEELNAEPNAYNRINKDNNLTIDATPEALQRIFGWEIQRVNPVEDLYLWEEINKPTKFPPCIKEVVREVGLSQPGRCDNGKSYP